MTSSDIPRPPTVHDLVATRAAETPDATAVVAGDQRISYGQLDQRANRLAHHLRAMGAGPDVVVGLCLNRSAELVVGALAILKAGAAYLPLDPASPPERLAFTLRDAGVQVLITSPDCLPTDSLPACEGGSGRGIQILHPGAAGESLGTGNRRPPTSLAGDDNLAYVIYTSGSTGQPKGVQVTHSNLMNLVRWHQQAFAVTSSDRATQLASPAFDAAVWELWPYLTAGASVYVPDEDTRMDPPRLRDWLVAQAITVTFVPTPLAETVMTLEWPADTALRLMLTGGDTLHRYPSATLPFALINNYGPTETAVVATSGLVPPASGWTTPPSIGRPISGARAYVQDEKRQPVLAELTGELYIGRGRPAAGSLHPSD